ncbi:MAG: hypothetical protein ACXVID_03155 [Thermoanaerobaculia bacterium]
MTNRFTPSLFTAIPVAAVRICMCMCSMSGAPPREMDGGFARSIT